MITYKRLDLGLAVAALTAMSIRADPPFPPRLRFGSGKRKARKKPIAVQKRRKANKLARKQRKCP